MLFTEKKIRLEINFVFRPFVFEVALNLVVDFIHTLKNFPTQNLRGNILREIKTGSENGNDKDINLGLNENRKWLKNTDMNVHHKMSKWARFLL